MLTHHDTLDEPVVKMAKRALETENVRLILPYVPKESEADVVAAFNKVLPLRTQPNSAHEIADMFFYEMVIRLHRMGEGAPYAEPATLEEAPIIPIAERAIETGCLEELRHALMRVIEDEIEKRFGHIQQLKQRLEVSTDDAEAAVDDAREYVDSMFGIQAWSRKVYLAATSGMREMAGDVSTKR
ncbi:MAG: hypothetical protein HYZ23_02045 [Chloroflexi bacterium]|nr:hypothetical protein [Chloroflexota bacterium]